jgi:hypothetical protein
VVVCIYQPKSKNGLTNNHIKRDKVNNNGLNISENVLLLVFAFISIFIFWPPSILIYNSTSTSIDNFTIYGKSLDNIPLNLPEVEITSPKNGDSVYPSSELTIKGTSSDTGNTNCTILTSINNIQPFQNASGIGSQGEQDFSNWNSTLFNATNLLRLGKNTITSFIVCLDTNSNTPTSSSHLINLTGLRSDNNQSIIMSSASRVIHDDLENKTVGQHKNSDQSTTNLNNLHTRPIHNNNDQSQSQSQSTLSPNSGQSTTGNP